MNPYKNDEFVEKAFLKGIRKMLINDIDEYSKIQRAYFSLAKENKVNQEGPKLYWMVEDVNEDF